MAKSKRQRGRPPVLRMPERIDASPEEIAEVVLAAKPKRTWRFVEEWNQERKRATESEGG